MTNTSDEMTNTSDEMTNTEERLLTAPEVAERLGVHENYVYALAKSGNLPSYRFGGNRRFRWTEIECWLEEQSGR